MRITYLLVALSLYSCSGSRVEPVPEPQPAVEPIKDYKVEEVTLSAQPTVAKMVTGEPEDAAKLIGGALGEVQAILKQKKIRVTGQPYVRSFEVSRGQWKFEAGLPVKKKAHLPPGEVKATELPAGKAAKVLYIGPYDKISAAYKAIDSWIVAQRLEKAGAPWEVYLSDPGSTKAVDLRTEVYLPVR